MLRSYLKRRRERRASGLYPLHQSHERIVEPDFRGLVVTSDIDRTYLQTSISSLRGLVRTAFESAEDKRAFAGMIPLYHALHWGPQETSLRVPLYFVSASPPQMEDVLREKMQLDGIHVDGLTFKDQLRLVRKGRIRELKKHIIYKLTALLLNRSLRPTDAHVDEILIGDDSETDAEAYLLYARILEGALSPEGLGFTLEGFGIRGRERDAIMTLASRKDNSRVVRIYIHCTTKHNPMDIFHQDPLLFAALDSLQMGLDAHQRGWIQQDHLRSIAQDLTPEEQRASLEELNKRKLLEESYVQAQRDYLSL